MSTAQQMTTDMAEAIDILPILADKFVVDFVNGIHVANDHIRVQKQRSSFVARLSDSWTGAGAARQAEVNENLANGVEASLKWLGELSESLAQTNYAVVCVNNRLNDLKHDVAKIAHYSADTRQLLYDLSEQVAARCDRIEHEVARIGLVQNAQLNLDYVFSKWSAGKYQPLSLVGRCHAAMEELWWGGFGDFYRSPAASEKKKQLVEIARNKTIDQLTKDAHTLSTARIDARTWLNQPDLPHARTLSEALLYLGDASNEITHPFIYSASQQPEQLPLRMPRLCSAEHLVVAMFHEVFGERAHV